MVVTYVIVELPSRHWGSAVALPLASAEHLLSALRGEAWALRPSECVWMVPGAGYDE